MKTGLDHLPAKKQRVLASVVKILFAEFEDTLKLATAKRKKATLLANLV